MKVGVLGCMAERLKGKLLDEEKLVDIVAGPDSYRNLPGMITEVIDGDKSVNVLLSREETYSDIDPVRLNSNGISSFVSIMRGCDNMCTFCVVPFTRGRERSRDPESIIKEVQKLVDNGYKEVTLLGQNVDSYRWSSDSSLMGKALKEAPRDKVVDFAKLLELVALVDPLLRVRFSTSHPKDISDDVIEMIAKYNNICNHIHLPVQSGSSRVLKMMNRTYTREWYLDKVAKIRSKIPNCAITTDIITGFCSETEEEHQETLSLIEACEFDMAFMYFYSERPGTLAAKKFKDDVSLADKKRRLSEVIETQHRYNLKNNLACVDQVFEVLVESVSKKSDNDLSGRTSEGKVVVFPKQNWKIGDYVKVKINKCTHATLIGEAI
jgi:tRNA-2-methylthio-N6-dimethylallyladenosine synthase